MCAVRKNLRNGMRELSNLKKTASAAPRRKKILGKRAECCYIRRLCCDVTALKTGNELQSNEKKNNLRQKKMI